MVKKGGENIYPSITQQTTTDASASVEGGDQLINTEKENSLLRIN